MKKVSNETNAILSAIEQICQEKKLSRDQVLSAIEQALAAAYRKDFGNKQQNIKVYFDPATGKMAVFDEKTVVEDLPEDLKNKQENEEEENFSSNLSTEILVKSEKRFNPKTEIQISEAQKLPKNKKKYQIGDIIKFPLEIPSDFGRIAAQTAKQVIVQRLREAERETTYENFKKLEKTIINGTVQRKERQNILIDLGETTAILPPQEQIFEERYQPDQKIKIYLLAVNQTSRGSEIIVSRRHPDIVKEVFKTEIPEVADGTVEIKAIAREAGKRSKVAVWSKEKSIDPIGACIGQRGVRIQTIIAEIGGEKIDIIEYDEKPEKFIVNALAPAKVVSLEINSEEKSALARVKKNQLSLAIGRDGQNVRLAAKLTGWRIEVEEEPEEEAKKILEEKGEENENEGREK